MTRGSQFRCKSQPEIGDDAPQKHPDRGLYIQRRVLISNEKQTRAIALCWVAHLVADAHQPCHAGSLYVEGVFPEGNRGANSIKTSQSRNMHALWDGLLGPKWDEGDLNRRAEESPTVEAAGNIESWLTESRELAVQNVYTPEVMEPISVALGGKTEVPKIDLPESYLNEVGRAAEAAVRLTEVLSKQ